MAEKNLADLALVDASSSISRIADRLAAAANCPIAPSPFGTGLDAAPRPVHPAACALCAGGTLHPPPRTGKGATVHSGELRCRQRCRTRFPGRASSRPPGRPHLGPQLSDRLRKLVVRASSSRNSRTFSIAITAWSAKVRSTASCFAGTAGDEPPTAMAPSGLSFAQQGNAEYAEDAPSPASA